MNDDVAELESRRDRISNDAVTGVRKTEGAHDPDAPTEEIEIESLDLGVASLPVTAPIAEPPRRKTSMPPPLPPAARRSSATGATPIPPAADLKARLKPPAPFEQRATPIPRLQGLQPSAAGASNLIRPAALSGATADTEALSAELERISKRMRERDAYLGELESVYAQRSEALLAAEEKLAEQQAELDARAARIRELELTLASRGTQPLAAGLDDLTRIRGIGPHYARLLQALGVQSFAAIAAWTPAECASFARQLKMNPGRVERDQWVEQASALCDRASLVTPSDEL
jgi:predicted flap endonuclease-1-like 5' DNA nuclease